MHGGSTIQLRPRNSFDGDKKGLATKQERVCRIPGLLRKEEENMVIFSSRQKTPSYVSQHVPGEYYSPFPAMISCVADVLLPRNGNGDEQTAATTLLAVSTTNFNNNFI